MLEPIISKAHDDRKDMRVIKSKLEGYEDKIELLECAVFNKEKKKDAFEDIYDKIAQQAAEIK